MSNTSVFVLRFQRKQLALSALKSAIETLRQVDHSKDNLDPFTQDELEEAKRLIQKASMVLHALETNWKVNNNYP